MDRRVTSVCDCRMGTAVAWYTIRIRDLHILAVIPVMTVWRIAGLHIA